MGTLNGKRAIVTGGGQGLGYAIAEQLVAAGADVAIHYFSSEAGARELKHRAESLGRRAQIFRADLTKEVEAVAFVRDAADYLGGLDVLVNNAGDLVERHTLEEIETSFWEHVLAINLTSLVWVTRAAVPWLLKAGQASIVNLSSLAGRKGGHGQRRRADLDARPRH
jgi:3-oxoacyl-[acyl-carrier protein] reductase